jgi:small-conductance mechanosensitive channel
MVITQIPSLPNTPIDYPHIVALLSGLLGICLAAAAIIGRAAYKFFAQVIEYLQKRADDERERGEREAKEAIQRWELQEKAKQERNEKLLTHIDATNRELTDYLNKELARRDLDINFVKTEIDSFRRSAK